VAKYPVAGLDVLIESPVPIIQDILPFSPQHRPGYKLNKPRKWIQHETANYNAGANAAMHSRWLRSASNTAYVSFHFCVDDKEIRQFVPIDEVTWQAGDGAGPGNYQCVSSELCVNSDGNETLSRRNAQNLSAQILYAMGYEDNAALGAHWDYNYENAPEHRHHCPEQLMFVDKVWGPWRMGAQAIIRELVSSEVPPAPPEPTYPPAVLPEWFDHQATQDRPNDLKYNGRTAYVCMRNYKALANTVPRVEPDTKAKASGPKILAGQKVFGVRLWIHPDDLRTWIITEDGHWLLASKFSPRVRIDPRTAE
jgi:N-acetylmuramoyl-L-alanine amidase CwlA